MQPLQLAPWIKRTLETRQALILFLYWWLTQCLVFSFSGVMKSVDTSLYLQSANELLTHFNLEDTHAFWYIGYSMVLAVILKVTESLLAVVVFQILLSGLALVAIYKSVLVIGGKKSVAFIACFLYVFWFEIHTWNVFIYTESLFVSCAIISFYLLIHAKTYLQYAITIAFLLFTCLIRPVGFSLLVASMVYVFAKVDLAPKAKMLVAFIAAGVALLLLNKMLESFELVASYAKSEIIYPDVTLLIEKNEIAKLPSGKYSLLVLAEFVYQHPVHFFELCAIKLALFFGHVKPYFSVLHNCYIVLVLYPLYFFAVLGYRLPQIHKATKMFFLSFVGLQAVTVMLTTENWDGRFLMPALPFIFILSAFGISRSRRTRISIG